MPAGVERGEVGERVGDGGGEVGEVGQVDTGEALAFARAQGNEPGDIRLDHHPGLGRLLGGAHHVLPDLAAGGGEGNHFEIVRDGGDGSHLGGRNNLALGEGHRGGRGADGRAGLALADVDDFLDILAGDATASATPGDG